MNIKRFDIEGFLSVDCISLPLNGNGLTLVFGKNNDVNPSCSNGAGKSSVFDAIFWCLFGTTARGLTADDVINWKTGKCKVLLEFSHRGNNYKVCRTRSPNGVSIFQGEKDLTKHTMQATQDLLTEILGIDSNGFRQIHYLCDGLSSRFTALNDVGRKLLLDQLLETPPEIGRAYDKVKAIIKSIVKQITDLSSQELQARSKLSYTENDIAQLKSKLELARTESLTYEADLKNRSSIALSRAADVETVYKKLESQIPLLELAKSKAEKSISEFTIEQTRLQFEINNLNEELRKLRDLRGQDRCPTCGNPSLDKDKIDLLLEEKEDSLNELEVQLHSNQSFLKGIKEEFTGYHQQLLSLSSKYQEAISQCKILRGESDNLMEGDSKKVLEGYQKIVYGLQQDIKSKETSILDLNGALACLLRESVFLREDNELNEILQSVFSPTGIKSMMLDEAINGIAKLASSYLSVLSNGTMKLELASVTSLKSGGERNKIGISVNGKGIASLSSGERRRIDLSIQLALADVVADVLGYDRGFLILDEVVDTLDQEGLRSTMSLLSTLATERLIFLTTHNPKASELALAVENSSVITVVKKDGLSRVAV